MDQPHALAVVVIETPRVSLYVLLRSAILVGLGEFPFRWIVDVDVVVRFVVVEDLLLNTTCNGT